MFALYQPTCHRLSTAGAVESGDISARSGQLHSLPQGMTGEICSRGLPYVNFGSLFLSLKRVKLLASKFGV